MMLARKMGAMTSALMKSWLLLLASPRQAYWIISTVDLQIWASNWGGNTQPSRFTIANNAVRVLGGAGTIWWNATIPSVAQEAFFTFTKVAPNAEEQALILKLNGNPNSNTSSFVEVRYDATNQTIQIWTRAPFTGWIGQGFFPATFAAGDQLGARVDENGQVNVFKNGVLIGSVSIMGGANPWLESALLDAGRIGVRFVGPTFDAASGDDAGFDDFGGGTPAGGAAIMMMSVSAAELHRCVAFDDQAISRFLANRKRLVCSSTPAVSMRHKE